MNNGIRALTTLGGIAKLTLAIFIFTCLVFVVLQLALMTSVQTMTAGFAEVLTVVALGVSVVWLLSFLASIILVAMWTFRAFSNLHEAGLTGLNYSPGWATAAFFVPLANLYIPFVALRELHNRSHGESDWHAAASVGDVTSWYACNWGALVVFLVAAGYMAVDSLEGVHVLLPQWAFLFLFTLIYLLLLGSAWYLMQIVKKVSDAQASGLHLSQSDVFA